MADTQGYTPGKVVNVVAPDGSVQHTVGTEELRSALRQGYSLARDQPNFHGVMLRRGDGSLEEVQDFRKAEDALLRGEADLASRAEVSAAREQAIYDSPAGQLATGAAALARGATFGLSDVAASGLDASWGADQQRLMAANPWTAAGGELAGALVPLALTGGASSAGSLAARGAARLGAVEGGLAARVAAGVTTGSLEGAALAVGKELSQASLEGRTLDSERIQQALGHGALLGGVLGGALPLAGAAARATGEAASSAAQSAIRRATGNEVKEALLQYAEGKALASTGGTSGTLAEIIEGSPQLRKAADLLLTKEAPAALGVAEGTLLSRKQLLQGIEAAGANARRETAEVLAVLDAASGGVGPSLSRVAQRAQDEVLSSVEGAALSTRASNELKKLVAEVSAYKDYRVSFSDLRKISDELGSIARGSQDSVYGQGARKLQGIVDEELLAGAKVASEKLGADIASSFTTASEKLVASRVLQRALDEGIKAEARAGVGLGVGELLATNQGTWIGTSIAGPVGGVVGTAAGAAVQAGVNRLKSAYGDQIVSHAARALAEGSPARMAAMVDGVIASSVARALSRSEQAGVAATEAAVEKGMLRVAAGRVWEGAKRGAEAAKDKGASGLSTQLDQQIKKALFPEPTQQKDVVGGRVPVAQRVANASSQVERGGASAAQVKELSVRLNRSAKEQQDAINRLLPTLPPDKAAVLRGQLKANEQTHRYLAKLIPASSNQQNSLTPQAEAPRMSRTQVDTLVTAVRVAADPLSVLTSLENGTLSKVEVDALKATAPEVYRQVSSVAEAQLRQRTTPLPYKEAVQLSLLLGIQGDPSMDPANASWLQQGYAPPAPQEQPPQQSAPTRKSINLARDWAVTKEEP